jgi:DNA-binding transcriptional LysR family regulator
MKLSLDDLALLVAIAEQGSFTSASKLLRQPKSTVSRRLADLELQLRVTLFQRTTRAISLTDAGRRIYEIAKPAIDAANDAADAIMQREQAVGGRVVITTTAALGQYLIAPKLPSLIERHPGLQVELRLTEQRLNIVSEGIDLAVRMGVLDDSDLVARRLGKVRRILVASPGYLAAHGTPTHPSELAAHRAILTSSALDRWRCADGWECQLRWNIGAGNMLVAHQLALGGAGIALLPDFLTHDDQTEGRLVPVLGDHWQDEADAWIVSSRQRYRSAAVRTVQDFLTASVGP